MSEKVLLGSKKNFLLMRDDVGKAKPSVRQLPPEGFSYGKPDLKDPENASKGKKLISPNFESDSKLEIP